MKREQDKIAERDFFNRNARNDTGDHVFDKVCSLKCFDLLGLGQDLTGVRMLEAGCGPGDWGQLLAERKATVVGVDLADEVIALNRKLNVNFSNYSCVTGDLEEPSLFPENAFDAVTCFNVLHHLPNPEAAVRNFARWLRDGGVFYAVEPNGGNLGNRISKTIRKVVDPFAGKLIQQKGLATVNEVKDHSMSDYLEVFGRHGFECDVKASVPWNGEFPRGNLIGLTAVISVVKWLLYHAVNHMPGDPINHGNPLVFRMSLNKGRRG